VGFSPPFQRFGSPLLSDFIPLPPSPAIICALNRQLPCCIAARIYRHFYCCLQYMGVGESFPASVSCFSCSRKSQPPLLSLFRLLFTHVPSFRRFLFFFFCYLNLACPYSVFFLRDTIAGPLRASGFLCASRFSLLFLAGPFLRFASTLRVAGTPLLHGQIPHRVPL